MRNRSHPLIFAAVLLSIAGCNKSADDALIPLDGPPPARAELLGVWRGMAVADLPAVVPNGRCEDKESHIACKATVVLERNADLTIRIENGVVVHATLTDALNSMRGDNQAIVSAVQHSLRAYPERIGTGERGDTIYVWTAADGSEVSVEGGMAVLAEAGAAQQRRRQQVAEVAAAIVAAVKIEPTGTVTLGGVQIGADVAAIKRCNPVRALGTAARPSGENWVPGQCTTSASAGPDRPAQEIEVFFDEASRKITRATWRPDPPVSATDAFTAEALREIPNGALLMPDAEGVLATASTRVHVRSPASGVTLTIESALPPDPVYRK